MCRAAVLSVLAVLALAGCGSSSPGSSPLTTELSYFPADSPFVMSVVTDPSSAAVRHAEQLVGKLPVATFGEAALMAKLQQIGINYDSDIKPLFGNPILFGLAGTGAAGARSEFLAVWITKDSSKLGTLIKKLFPAAHRTSSRDGATLYSEGTLTFSIAGATLAVSSSPQVMSSALDRHAHGGGIKSADYSRAVSGLPQDALVQATGNLTNVLSTSGAATARRVPWIGALRGYAASITTDSGGLHLHFELDTTGGALTPAQVPLAPGATPPSLASTFPIEFGVHDPGHLIAFAEAAEQAANPGRYREFLTRQSAVRRKTGVDLNTLLSLLTGDLILASDTHTTMARAALRNVAKATTTLAKLASDPHSVFPHATSVTRKGGGFYVVKEPTQTLTIGIASGQLVVGKATPAQLAAFAAAPTVPASGAKGPVAFRIGLAQLVGLALKHPPSIAERAVLGTLGDLTGWATASTSATTGTATLTFK